MPPRQPLHRREDLARAALAAKGYSTDELSVSRLLNSIDSKPEAERRRYLNLLSSFGEPFEGPPEQAPVAAASPTAAPAVAAASPPAAPLPAGAGPGPPAGPVPVAADPAAGLDPTAPVAMVPRAPAPPPEDDNLFRAALGDAGDLFHRAGVSFMQSAVMPVEGVAAIGLRAAGQDPAAAGFLSGALESTLPEFEQAQRRATGQAFSKGGLAAVGQRLIDDPQSIADIVAGAAGFLIPMGAVGRLLKLAPLARTHPRIVATAGEAIVSGAAALPELAENDEISIGKVVAGAVGTALATGAVSGAGRLVGGSQIEDLVSGVGPHVGRSGLRTVAGEMVEEAVEESAQGAVSNVTQGDPAAQGLPGSVVGGLIGGGAMGGAAAFAARPRSAARAFLGISPEPAPEQERVQTPSEPRKPAEAPTPAPTPERPVQAQPAAPAPEEAAQPTEAADAGIPRDEGRQEDQAEAQAQEDEVATAPEPAPSPAPAADVETAPPAATEPAAEARPAHQPAVGETGEVVGQDNVDHPVRYEVVEAADLIASNTAAQGTVGKPDPRYDAALQGRDLREAAERLKIEDISKAPDPRRLGRAVAVDTGAPVVGPDMQVEAGNSRTLGIKIAYQQGRAGDYRRFVDSVADTKGMKQPVLVRVRTDELTPEQRVEFAGASNIPTAARLSTTRQAFEDARRMSPATVAAPDADDYLQRLVSDVVPAAERGPLLGAKGGLSPEGRTRMENALVARAYDDERTVEHLFAAADPDTVGVRNALTWAAPGWAAMREHLAEAGGPDPTPQLQDALGLIRRSREDKRPIQSYFAQGDLLPGATTEGEYGRDVQSVLKWFYKDRTFDEAPDTPTEFRPQDEINERLQTFTDAGRNWTSGDMFGAKPSLVEELETGAIDAVVARPREKPAAAPMQSPAARAEVVGDDPMPVDVDLADRNELAWYEGLVRDGGRVPDGVRILNRPAGVPAPNTWEILPDDDVVRGRADRERADREAEIDRVVADVQAAAARILPAAARVKVERGEYIDAPQGGKARGLYWPGGLVQVAARSEDPAATLRHESIHALKRLGFITPSEWRRLERAAEKGDWAEKHDVDAIYGHLDLTPEQRTEEAVAKEFESWWQDQRAGREHEAPGVVARVWRRIRALLTALADRVWPHSPAALWRAIERGEVARRTPRAVAESGPPMAARARDERGELLEAWEQDDRGRRQTAGDRPVPKVTAAEGGWANTELLEAARSIGEAIRPLVGEPDVKERAKQAKLRLTGKQAGPPRSFVGPGGGRIPVNIIDQPARLARVLTRNLAHLPGWLSDLRAHVDLKGRMPRGNTLQLIRTLNVGVQRARKKIDKLDNAKEIRQQAKDFSLKWTPGRKVVSAEYAWLDVASALVADPMRLIDEAPDVAREISRHAAASQSFHDATIALLRENSGSEARTAIDFVHEIGRRGWHAGAQPSPAVIEEAVARAWAEANPYDALSLESLSETFAEVRNAVFDKTGSLRRADRMNERQGGEIRDAAAMAREIAYVNADPLLRRAFKPVVDAVQALGGTGARTVNDFLIALRVIQGDPTYEQVGMRSKPQIVFDHHKRNPGGLNVETATASINAMREEMGEADFEHLARVRIAVQRANRWMTQTAEKAGLITPEAAALYYASPAYVPYAPVEHNDPFQQMAGFRPRKGSMSYVRRVLPELAAKMRATLIAAARNTAIRTAVQQQAELQESKPQESREYNVLRLRREDVTWGDQGISLTPAAKTRLKRYRGRGHRPVDWTAISYSDKGELQFYAVERSVRDAFYRYGNPNVFIKLGRAMNTLSRTLILRADPMWLLYDNPGMDIPRGWLALHGARPAGRRRGGALRGTLTYARDVVGSLAVAAGRAKAPFNRSGMDPANLRLLEVLQEIGILPEDALVEGDVGQVDQERGGRILDEALGQDTEKEIEERAEQEAAARIAQIHVEQSGLVAMAAGAARAIWDSRPRRAAARALDVAMMFSETPSKVAAALHYARERLAEQTGERPGRIRRKDPRIIRALRAMPPETRDFIRTSIGSPDFHLSGTAHQSVNALFQFLPPSANAMAADAAVATNPATRAGWWTKFLMISALPAALTIVKHTEFPEDDERLAVARELSDRLKRIPRWRLWSDIVVPLGSTATGRTISWTAPVEHSVRLPLSLFLLSLDTALRKERGTATGLFEEAVGDIAKALPGLSWWIPVGSAALSLAMGQPHIDAFRGRSIISDDELEATTTGQRMLRVIGYGLASVGVRNPDLVMAVEPIQKANEGALERLLRVPWFGKVVRRGLVVDDAGLRETAEQAARGPARAAARARTARRQALADAAEVYRETGRREYARIGREYFAAHEGAVRGTADARIALHRAMRVAAEVFPERPGFVDVLAFGSDAEAAAAAKGLIRDGGVEPAVIRRAANQMFAGREGRGGSVRRLGLIHRAIREAGQ